MRYRSVPFAVSNKMQNPNEDTEWNDILRKKGIIPEKTPEPEISEETLLAMMDKTIKEKRGIKDLEDMNLEELDELEDEEDERILLEYRNQRLAEMRALQERSKYGQVREITAPEYVKEVRDNFWNLAKIFCSIVQIDKQRYIVQMDTSLEGKQVMNEN